MKTIVIASNKGGTGKTTMSCALARSFAEIASTALLDADVTGPDVLSVLGIPCDHARFDLEHFYPETVSENLRGNMIKELLKRVVWNDDIEYMIIDSPPSTSDELLTVLLETDPAGVVIVTLGSATSITDAKRLIAILRNEKFNIPIIGYIRNMVNVFGKGDLDEVYLIADMDMSDSLDVDHIRDIIIERVENDK